MRGRGRCPRYTPESGSITAKGKGVFSFAFYVGFQAVRALDNAQNARRVIPNDVGRRGSAIWVLTFNDRLPKIGEAPGFTP